MAASSDPAPHPSEPYLLVWLALRLKGLGEVANIAEVHNLSPDETADVLAQLVADEYCVYRPVDGPLGGPAGGPGKFILTPNGRDKGEEALAAELANSGTRQIVQDAYRQFRKLNPAMLQLCTDWQVVPAGYTPPPAIAAASATPADQPAAASATSADQPAAASTTTPADQPTATATASPPPAPARRLNDHADPTYDTAVLERLTALNTQLAAVLTPLAAALERYSNYRRRFDVALERLSAGELSYFTKPVVSSYHTVWFELHEDLLATLNLNRAQETARPPETS